MTKEEYTKMKQELEALVINSYYRLLIMVIISENTWPYSRRL